MKKIICFLSILIATSNFAGQTFEGSASHNYRDYPCSITFLGGGFDGEYSLLNVEAIIELSVTDEYFVGILKASGMDTINQNYKGEALNKKLEITSDETGEIESFTMTKIDDLGREYKKYTCNIKL